MKIKLVTFFLIGLISITNAQKNTSSTVISSSPKVLIADDYINAGIEKICKTAGIQVVNTQPKYLEIKLGVETKINTFIDIDAEKKFLIFNISYALIDGANASDAFELASEMNLKTNLLRAAYDKKKNKMDFTYYYWIKDGYVEKSLVSALEMYRIGLIYAISLDTKNILK